MCTRSSTVCTSANDLSLLFREQFLGFNAKYPAVFTKRECQNALDTFEKYKDIKVKWNPRQEPLETSASATISRKNQVTSVWHAKQPASWMIEPDTRLGKSKGNATTAGEVALAHQQAPRLENAEGMMRTKRKSPRVAEEDGDDEYCDMSSKQRVARPRKKAKISRPKEKLRRKGQASNNDDDDYHP